MEDLRTKLYQYFIEIYRRVFMNDVRTFEDIFPSLEYGCLQKGIVPDRYKQDYEKGNGKNGKKS